MFVVLFAMLGLQLAFAQTKQITGTVTSADDGLGIPGVSVIVKGTTIGATTDIDGKYTLSNVPQDADFIVFSFVGLKTVEMPANQYVINVVMQSDSKELDEVVVVAYGVSKKASFTGSASQIKSDELTKAPAISVSDAIAGLTSGVNVTGGSGQPGATPSIRIRGIGSINSSNEPLYVIDGVAQMQDNLSVSTSASLGALSSLNPSDIATVTVLKDAAAAALYGSRAANGVVLITTKKGSAGDTKFSFKSELGFSDFAVKTLELASPKEALAYKIEGYKNYLVEYEGFTAEDAMSTATADITGYFSEYDPSRPASDYDWDDALFRRGVTKNIELSASGGSEKTQFFASLGYNYSEGVANGSDFDRISGRLNLDHKANKYLDFGLNTSLSRMEQNVIPTAGYYYANPLFATRTFLNQLTPIKDENGNYTNVEGGKKPNLVKENGLNVMRNGVWKNISQGYVQVNILDGLTFKSTNSFDFTQIYGERYWSPLSKDGLAYNGYAHNTNKRRTKLTTSNILSYAKSFNKVHNLDALVGFEAEQLTDQLMSMEGKNFPNDNSQTLDVAAKPLSASYGEDGDRMQSVLSRVNYNYDNKYYASVSYRTDASSRLGANNRWGHFYSISGSWRISQEEFMQDVKYINDWKLRASYGVNGTLPSDWVGALGLYSYGQDYNGTPGSYYSQIENKDLRWEKNNNLSIATEIRAFGFLSAEIEYYNRKTDDLLLEVPVSRTTGFSSYWDNVGAMTNKGIEVTLTSRNIDKNSFTWETQLNLAHNTNKIDRLDGQDNTDTFPFILREGESFNSIYLRDWAGVNPANGHGQWYILENEKRVDKDGDGKFDVTENASLAAKRIVGCGDPLLFGSITNNFSYKGFDLSFMFTFKVGGDSYIDPHNMIFDDGETLNYAVTKEQLKNYWREPGDNAELPIVSFMNSQHTSYNSSRRLVDGSYLRLKKVTMGYSVPQKFVSKVGIANARVYASASNLFTLSKVEGFDPETSARGVILENFDFPPLKTVTFGIQLNF